MFVLPESDVLDEELDDNPFAAIKPMSSQVSIGTDKPTGNHGNQQADPQALHDYVLGKRLAETISPRGSFY